MASAPRNTWQEFEDLVENIHRKFHPNAKVTRDDHIVGKDSKNKRQIDVSVRYQLGPNDLLIVVECKRHARKVDVQAMESFVQKLTDVEAHLGVMVAETGYTNGAERIARRHGIKTYTLRDARRGEWSKDLVFRFFVEATTLHMLGWSVTRSDGSPISFSPGDTVHLMEGHGGKEKGLNDLVREVWQKEGKKQGEAYYRFATRTVPDEEAPHDHLFTVGYRAETKHFMREASLEFIGLADADDATHMHSFKMVSQPGSQATYFSEPKFWQRIKSHFALVVQCAVVVYPHEQDPTRREAGTFSDALSYMPIAVSAVAKDKPITLKFGKDKL